MPVRDLVFILATAAIVAVLPVRGAPLEAPGLPRAMLERAEAAGIPVDAIGVLVRRRGEAIPLIDHQAARAFQPASTLKLLTSAVALETLGPDYRARTELRSSEAIRGEVFRGDLSLRGFADPDFDLAAFERMLRRLRAMGVRELRGDLLLDRGFFEPTRSDVGLAPFDEAPEFRYNVIPDALPLSMGLVHLELASDAKRVAVAVSPDLPMLRVRSALRLVDAPCDKWEDIWKTPLVERGSRGIYTATLQGDYPRDCNAGTDIALLDRDDLIDGTFRALWRGMGGHFAGRVREGRLPDSAPIVAVHRSRALAELTRDVNKRSDNPVARTVWLTLGALAPATTPGTTAARSDSVVREWLRRHRIPDDGLVLENGSGLSRRERIAPLTLAGVVEAALDSPWSPEFMGSLPIVAVDGGMRNRLRDTPAAEGHARIKTGTLRDTWAVAGYVDAVDGNRYVVAAMVNHDGATPKDARGVLDALLEAVAKGLR